VSRAWPDPTLHLAIAPDFDEAITRDYLEYIYRGPYKRKNRNLSLAIIYPLDLRGRNIMMDEEINMFGKMAMALNILEDTQDFAAIIPEVRTNLVYAREKAKTRDEVLGVEGRITVVNGFPKAAGKPRFGASSHMARLLLEIRKIDPTIRAGIDFANNPAFARWLQDYCSARGWTFSVIDRRNEPEEIREAEGASMPWKAAEAIRAAGGCVPKIFYETGAIGKESVSVLVGKDPIEVVEQVCEIARLYHEGR